MGITNQLSQLLQKKDQNIINDMDLLDVTRAMRFIKTRRCPLMGHDFVTDAMLIYVEKKRADSISNDEIIDHYVKMKNCHGAH